MQAFLILLGSITNYGRNRASCPQYHFRSDLCLLMELSLRAAVAADVYLLVGAGVMLFCVSGWKCQLDHIKRDTEVVFFSPSSKMHLSLSQSLQYIH